jgi:hypothetical protein
MPWPLIPRLSWAPWGGDILNEAEAQGRALLLVWLGLCVEICIGRVKRANPEDPS